jgi:uncharacterized protein
VALMGEEARIEVRVQTRAARQQIIGVRDGVLHVRVSAPPVGGAANRALCRLIAARAHIAPSRVHVIRGEHARTKLVRVDGMSTEALRAALTMEA